MGRLLYDFGIIDAKTVNKLVKEAEKAGKGSFALAWVMDQTEEERSHGVTVIYVPLILRLTPPNSLPLMLLDTRILFRK